VKIGLTFNQARGLAAGRCAVKQNHRLLQYVHGNGHLLSIFFFQTMQKELFGL